MQSILLASGFHHKGPVMRTLMFSTILVRTSSWTTKNESPTDWNAKTQVCCRCNAFIMISVYLQTTTCPWRHVKLSTFDIWLHFKQHERQNINWCVYGMVMAITWHYFNYAYKWLFYVHAQQKLKSSMWFTYIHAYCVFSFPKRPNCNNQKSAK